MNRAGYLAIAVWFPVRIGDGCYHCLNGGIPFGANGKENVTLFTIVDDVCLICS